MLHDADHLRISKMDFTSGCIDCIAGTGVEQSDAATPAQALKKNSAYIQILMLIGNLKLGRRAI